jgi:spore coat protein U-like protein
MIRIAFALILLAAIILAPPYSQASANCFSCNCTVTATTVPFGNYSFLTLSATGSTGTVTFACSGGNRNQQASVTISLSSGSGTFTTRTMALAANKLNYNLYLDAGHTQIWGDGTGSTRTWTASFTIDNTGHGSGSAPVYGLLAPTQKVPKGTYLDTVTQTISY